MMAVITAIPDTIDIEIIKINRRELSSGSALTTLTVSDATLPAVSLAKKVIVRVPSGRESQTV
jgi:hypothetical protein